MNLCKHVQIHTSKYAPLYVWTHIQRAKRQHNIVFTSASFFKGSKASHGLLQSLPLCLYLQLSPALPTLVLYFGELSTKVHVWKDRFLICGSWEMLETKWEVFRSLGDAFGGDNGTPAPRSSNLIGFLAIRSVICSTVHSPPLPSSTSTKD
jgi:hypothetical protein